MTWERLAVLLTAIFAAVGWAVSQLSDTVSDDNVIAYQTSREYDFAAKAELYKFAFENISRGKNPGQLNVTLAVTGSDCHPTLVDEDGKRKLSKDDFVILSRNVSPRILEPAERGLQSVTFTFDRVPPGAAYEIVGNGVGSCEVIASLAATDIATRAIGRGLEYWLVEYKLWILLAIVAILLTAILKIYRMAAREIGRDQDETERIASECGACCGSRRSGCRGWC